MIFVDNINLKYLPYSGRRYIVSRDGLVMDKLGNRLPTLNIDEQLNVELSWLNGVSNYLVGVLVIVTFQPMYLPEHLWANIIPLHLDEDHTNNSDENLKYTFVEGGIPLEGLDSFYYIPMFTKYAINRLGEMVTAENLRPKTWGYVKPDILRNSKGGYFYTRVVNEPGVNSVLLRHRAMCYTFKPVTSAKHYELLVNHVNGNPGDDWVDNLEWATYSQNNKHAHDNGLTGNKATEVLVKDLRTGEITSFKNTKRLAKYLGHCSNRIVRYRLRHASTTLYEDYLQFKWDDGSDWLTMDMTATPKTLIKDDRIAALNVHTGEVNVFETFDEVASKLGIDKQTIAIHLRDNQVIPFYGFNFSWYQDNIEWPKHSDINLRAYKKYPFRTPDPVIMTDLSTGETEVFESRNELAVRLDISESYATQLVSNGITYKNRYTTKYHKLRENIIVPLGWKI